MKEKSYHFKDKEIIGFTYIDGKRVTVLKMGVRRRRCYDYSLSDLLMPNINQSLMAVEKWEKFKKEIMGDDEFEDYN